MTEKLLSLSLGVVALLTALVGLVTQYIHCRRDKRIDAKHDSRLDKLENWTE